MFGSSDLHKPISLCLQWRLDRVSRRVDLGEGHGPMVVEIVWCQMQPRVEIVSDSVHGDSYPERVGHPCQHKAGQVLVLG